MLLLTVGGIKRNSMVLPHPGLKPRVRLLVIRLARGAPNLHSVLVINIVSTRENQYSAIAKKERVQSEQTLLA